MIDAIMFAHEEIKKQVAFQEKIMKEVFGSVGKQINSHIHYDVVPDEINTAVREYADKKYDEMLKEFDRHVRDAIEEGIDAEIQEHFAEIFPEQEKAIAQALYALKKEKVRRKVLDKGIRPDGRKLNEIRPI